MSSGSVMIDLVQGGAQSKRTSVRCASVFFAGVPGLVPSCACLHLSLLAGRNGGGSANIIQRHVDEVGCIGVSLLARDCVFGMHLHGSLHGGPTCIRNFSVQDH